MLYKPEASSLAFNHLMFNSMEKLIKKFFFFSYVNTIEFIFIQLVPQLITLIRQLSAHSIHNVSDLVDERYLPVRTPFSPSLSLHRYRSTLEIVFTYERLFALEHTKLPLHSMEMIKTPRAHLVGKNKRRGNSPGSKIEENKFTFFPPSLMVLHSHFQVIKVQ